MRFGRHLLALSIAAASFAAISSGASAAGCRAPRSAGDFEVRVNIDPGEATVHNHLSKAQLGTSNLHGRRAQILEWKNVYCFWTASAVVDISYHQLDVNIASDYEPGSCQYEAVLDHEYEHVGVAQNIMQPYAQQIRQALTTLAIPTAHLPSLANSPEIAAEEVEEVFRRTLIPVRDQMGRLLVERQAEVDTLENYRRTWKRCRKW
jgi:hypothetical protein